MTFYKYINYKATQYLYVSRRSLALPSIKNNDLNEILDNLVLPPLFDLSNLSDALGLNYNQVITIAKKMDIDYTKQFKRAKINESKEIIDIITHFKDDIYKSAQIQAENFKQYLKQE